MNLLEEILKEHSKQQCNKIVQWVGFSQKRFDELLQLFLNGKYQVTQRVAWPLCNCVKAHPSFIKKNFTKLINKLQQPNIHNGVKRHTVKLLQYVDIPKKLQGEVMDICFGFVASPTEAVAIKAFSLTILHQLAIIYPEILPEIKLLIENQIHHQTAAFKSRAKQFF